MIEKTIKKAMIDKGREDFTVFLAEILNCSQTWASVKFKKNQWTSEELKRIGNALNIEPSVLGEGILMGE